MQKILIFTDTFLPGYKGGGPITSIANLVLLLNDSFEIFICTSNHDLGDSKVYDGITSDRITKYKQFNVIYLSNMYKANISKVIDEFNPDLLYLNSFFSKTTQVIMTLNKLKYHKKLIVAPRGELQKNALNIKKTKKSLYLFIFKLLRLYKGVYFHSTDSIETKSIRDLFNIDNITQLQNAVKIQKFKPLKKKKNELKIIFVSRISRKKNLHFALEALKEIETKIIFDIYGPKEDKQYWSKCQSIIDTMPSNVAVSYKGSLAQSGIINKMRKYHAFLFPTLSENFGHVIVEAMQAGLVPIISDQTPWRSLEDRNAGWDIPLDSKIKYRRVIEELYRLDDKLYENKSLAIMEYIYNKLDMKKLTKNYIGFFNKTIGEGNNV